MVEINGDANNPEPMDMDHHGKEDGDNNKGTRENNKAPGTQQGAANGKKAKESRNNSDAPVLPGGTLILILIGVTAWRARELPSRLQHQHCRTSVLFTVYKILVQMACW